MTKREKQVYSYMVALSRLYGILEWKQFIKVFNKYNLPKITKTEINNTPMYWNKSETFCSLYSDVLVYSRVDEELIDHAQYQAEGKKYYMPTEDEILALSKPKEYMQQSAEHTALYDTIKDILLKNPPKDISVDEMHKIMCVTLGAMISAGENQQVIFDVLGQLGLIFTDMDEAQKFAEILTNAWNNTRVWANRGFTPNEMDKEMSKTNEPEDPEFVISKTAKAPDTNNEFAAQFYKLWYKLIYWINGKYNFVPPFPVPVYGEDVDEQPFIKIREKLWNAPHYINEFLSSDGANGLNESERQTVRAWGEKFIKGKFVIHKHLKDYSVFQSMEQGKNKKKLYGVCGITNSIPDALGRKTPPLVVEAVILPFNGKIVYDTFLAPYNISFSADVKKNFAEFYKETYEKDGIITSL